MTDLTEAQVRDENHRIARENTAKIDAMPDLAGIKLTRIDLTQNHAEASSQHPDIVDGKYYLALIYGKWFLGTFGKVWYGWSFHNWGNSGIQLDHIQIVYETDLVIPDLKQTPFMTFEPTECEWCSAKLPEDKDEHSHDENGRSICDDCWASTYA